MWRLDWSEHESSSTDWSNCSTTCKTSSRHGRWGYLYFCDNKWKTFLRLKNLSNRILQFTLKSIFCNFDSQCFSFYFFICCRNQWHLEFYWKKWTTRRTELDGLFVHPKTGYRRSKRFWFRSYQNYIFDVVYRSNKRCWLQQWSVPTSRIRLFLFSTCCVLQILMIFKIYVYSMLTEVQRLWTFLEVVFRLQIKEVNNYDVRMQW